MHGRKQRFSSLFLRGFAFAFGAAAAAAAGFALVCGHYLVSFFLPAIATRGPLRVRAFVWVR